MRILGFDKTINSRISINAEHKARAKTINLAHQLINVLQVYSIEKESLGKFVFPVELKRLMISLNETTKLKNLLNETDVQALTAASRCTTDCPEVLLIDFKEKTTYQRPVGVVGEVVYKSKNCQSAMCKHFEVEVRYVGAYETLYDSQYFDKN